MQHPDASKEMHDYSLYIIKEFWQYLHLHLKYTFDSKMQAHYFSLSLNKSRMNVKHLNDWIGSTQHFQFAEYGLFSQWRHLHLSYSAKFAKCVRLWFDNILRKIDTDLQRKNVFSIDIYPVLMTKGLFAWHRFNLKTENYAFHLHNNSVLYCTFQFTLFPTNDQTSYKMTIQQQQLTWPINRKNRHDHIHGAGNIRFPYHFWIESYLLK